MRTRVDKVTSERINLALSELDREIRAALANGDIGSYTVLDNAFIVQHYLDTTREAVFSLASLTAATRRTYTLPDADTTVVGTTNTQTLTNKTIALGSNAISGDITAFNAALTGNDFATLAGAETLTNKTINLTSNTLAGTTAQFNTALSDNDFATLAGSETLTNKTLTTPTIGDFSNATHNHSNAAGGGTLSASAIGSGTLALARGGTNADLSATGGASNVLQQASAGAAITVGQLAASNLSNGTTGSGSVVLATSPTLVTPALGTPSSGVLTNCTGTASGLTAGNVTTNANLTGPITSVGNATTIADAELSAIAGLTSAANKFPGFTGSGTATLHDIVSGAVAHNSANFTATSGSWTVDAGDQLVLHRARVGPLMFVSFDIATSDVSAATANLLLKLPDGLTAAATTRGKFVYSDAGGAFTDGEYLVSSGTTNIQLYTTGFGAWTITSSDNTRVLGTALVIVAVS